MNKRTTPQRVVERANIVLCSAEGRSGSAICREVGVSRPTVTQWLDRYEAGTLGTTTRRRDSMSDQAIDKLTSAVKSVNNTLREINKTLQIIHTTMCGS